MISAEIHSDDFRFKVDFDATPWFEQATSEQIIALIKCDWRGDYAADDVATFFEDVNSKIANLLDYCRRGEGDFGFEVSVNGEEALNWLFPPMAYNSLQDLQNEEKEVCKEILKLDIDGIQQVSGFIVALKNIIRQQEQVIANLKQVASNA